MDYRLLLMNALSDSRARNPQFSLRAMARQLALSPAHLSQLLSGKRPITVKAALKIAEKLEMTDEQRRRLLIQATHAPRFKSELPRKDHIQVLSESEIEPIADWKFFAILSLGGVRQNRASAKWIAKQLGIDYLEAKHAFEKLKMFGYIEESGEGFRQSSRPLQSTTDIPSAVIRRFHRQNLQLARDRMESIPVELRDFSSFTFAIEQKKLARAKKIIQEFKAKFTRAMKSSRADAVYNLGIQFYPVTKIRGTTK